MAELTQRHLGSTSAGWWWCWRSCCWRCCCWVENCSKIFSPALPSAPLLISCAGLSSRRPLLALSFIHIAAEARVSQNSGGQVESTLLSPIRWQVTLSQGDNPSYKVTTLVTRPPATQRWLVKALMCRLKLGLWPPTKLDLQSDSFLR